jgi:uncharacterized membrane protein YsdA (DUF1294 family)
VELIDPPGAGVCIALSYAGMSIVTLAAYGIDKQRARRGRWRIRERTLHLLELLGGWPGALLAQPLFRHKRRKFSFLAITWLIAFSHLTFWIAWLLSRR